MDPRARRILITLLVIAFAVIIILPIVWPTKPPSGGGAGPGGGKPATTTTPDAADDGPTAEDDGGDQAAQEQPEDAPPPGGGAEAVQPEPEEVAAPVEPPAGLHAVAPSGSLSAATPPASMGSFDWRTHRMLVEFTPHGAGIQRITFSDLWETAGIRRQVEQIKKEIVAGNKTIADLPAADRYVLRTAEPSGRTTIPVLAVHSVKIGDERVSLFGEVWSEIASGHFVSEVRDGNGEPVLRIERRFVLPRRDIDPNDRKDPNARRGYDLTVRQTVTNLSDGPLQVQLCQYGPPSLRVARDRYMDRRRFRFGYAPDRAMFPDLILSKDNKLLYEHNKLIKNAEKAADPQSTPQEQRELLTLWPNATSRDHDYDLSWFGSTNRYFALAVHPALDDRGAGNLFLGDFIGEIRFNTTGVGDPIDQTVFTYLFSATQSLAANDPQSEADDAVFDLGVYAGPLDRHILDKEQPYVSLAMHGLILYQMSSCCAFCTFQWLAELLLAFLSVLHGYVLFDWGLAIIGLVIVVRAILHPLTKRSQISMQRFTKKTAALQPELEKLKKKYGDDPKRMQQEQMRLWKEHGVSPFGCLGFLPMFLQTPIWIALYAMLYFVFDLRQEPAFFGVFQLFWDWPFLGDLSAADQFITLPFQGRFWMFDYSAINVLPLIMGAVFFFQQKYMSPPPSASMSKEQITQQKMMKIMMVVMFPIMLYSAPSGLTLYILTSSSIGILESKYIRAHIKEMDLNPPKKKKKVKPRDAQGRAFAASLEAAKEKRRQKLAGPPKKYKKRK
ncbi:MAG: membrane protein insertase YidC [Phycisphaerales bacterium]|nr:MAG: membrane protein insertase YidC [Phycisphaerales bacterium]